jgi:cytidylate kinase
MARLVVVTGPPGAGKSTVAGLLADRFERSVLVAGDDFFGFVRRGYIAPWLPESREQNEVVTEAGAAATARYVAGGFDTVYDGVVGPWMLPTFAALVGRDRFDYAVLLPTVEVCLHRVATRHGHGFTSEPATRKMHQEFAGAAADVDPRHVLVDPPDTPEAVADMLMATLTAGDLSVEV